MNCRYLLILAFIAAFELASCKKIVVHLPAKTHHHTHVVYKHIHHIIPHVEHIEELPKHESAEEKEAPQPPIKYAGSKIPQKLHTSFSASSKHKGSYGYATVVHHPESEMH